MAAIAYTIISMAISTSFDICCFFNCSINLRGGEGVAFPSLCYEGIGRGIERRASKQFRHKPVESSLVIPFGKFLEMQFCLQVEHLLVRKPEPFIGLWQPTTLLQRMQTIFILHLRCLCLNKNNDFVAFVFN